MDAALALLLIGCLVQGALGQEFKIFLPQTIDVLNGSCVTIPCSFDIESKHETGLDKTCTGIWLKDTSKRPVGFHGSSPELGEIKGNLTGDLMSRDCTTTLNDMKPQYSRTYFFRLECKHLKYTYDKQNVRISVKDDPHRPTLTPSTLKVREGTSVTLTCSAPAPCLSLPPTLTWTPGLGESQETLQENQDKTKVKVSVVNFTASHLHHRQEISCTAVYSKQDGSTESSVNSSLTADVTYPPKGITVSVSPSGPVKEDTNVTLTCSSDANPAVNNYTWYSADEGLEDLIGAGRVLSFEASKDTDAFFCKAENELGAGQSNNTQIDVQFAPQILPSADCTKTVDQVNCSCNTSGNPPPTFRWYMNGSPANNSGNFAIRYEAQNLIGVSFIAVSQAQWGDRFTLLCLSSNSLGSASQRFVLFLETKTSAADSLILPIFITAIVALLVLVCALLFFIRSQKSHYNRYKSQCSGGNTSTVAVSQPPPSGEGQEVLKSKDEDIYVNTFPLQKAHVAQPATIPEPNSTSLPSYSSNNTEGARNSSVEKNTESEDVTYSVVTWRSKNEGRERGSNTNRGDGSNLQEEKCTEGALSRDYVKNAVEMGNLYDDVKPRIVKKESECEYAQVKFKDNRDLQK
ncbi:sialoadhesin-like isoform X1 [Notolabrus celidotus]|uniref:sialoadhesin-like isoform X1 n=1 Tax=Notolabrus celidotus TaxID=1203425 RepID=UPI00148F46D9|nr:sialoadhesin-like isoform X1 [Notolabrus celidotus]